MQGLSKNTWKPKKNKKFSSTNFHPHRKSIQKSPRKIAGRFFFQTLFFFLSLVTCYLLCPFWTSPAGRQVNSYSLCSPFFFNIFTSNLRSIVRSKVRPIAEITAKFMSPIPESTPIAATSHTVAAVVSPST